MPLKRGLTRLDGVADAKLILKPAHMAVTMKPGYWPDLLRMEDTIRRAGYTPVPEAIVLTVTGKLVRAGDGFRLELDGMKSPTVLRIERGTLDPEKLTAQSGKVARVEGTWRAPAAGEPAAGVITLRPPRSSDGH